MINEIEIGKFGNEAMTACLMVYRYICLDGLGKTTETLKSSTSEVGSVTEAATLFYTRTWYCISHVCFRWFTGLFVVSNYLIYDLQLFQYIIIICVLQQSTAEHL
jgi:hypothetical protein